MAPLSLPAVSGIIAAALLAGQSLLLAEGIPFRRVIDRVASVDPADCASVFSARCCALVYETLLEYDYEARPYRLKPCLAASMPEVSPDGLTYTFTINTNVFFSADPCFGDPQSATGPSRRRLTAGDFVYSFKRLADSKTASSGYWIVEGKIAGIDAFHAASAGAGPTDYSMDVEGLVAETDDILKIKLTAPSPVFLWTLAMPYTAAVAREAVEYYGAEFRSHPVGTGPYLLSEWRRNYKMVFRRNAAWRGWRASGAAFFDPIVFPLIDDPSTQWLAFLAGELDFMGEIARDNWDQVVMTDGTLNPALAANGVRMLSIPTLEVSYIGINMDDPVLGKNLKLRQALNAAFDTASWEAYYRGRSGKSNGPVPPHVAGAVTNDLPYGRGLDTARRLLAEAGYPDGRDPATGKRLRLTLDIGKTSQDIRESTELFVSFIARCGVEIVPEYSTWPAFLKKVSQRRSQMFRIGWVGDYPDAENFLQLFYGPNSSPGPNRCNYSNPRYDALFREAMAASSDSSRLELYGELQKMIQYDSPWIFLGFSRSASLVRDTVKNYLPHDFPYGMEKYYEPKQTDE